jgi:hypothetical protein
MRIDCQRLRTNPSSLIPMAFVAMFIPAHVSFAQSPVTFTKDIAPILQRSCQNCHRVGQIGPMPLLTYEDARPWARAIKQQVVQRNMPPWYIDKAVGVRKFKNDPSLGEEDIALISKWVDAGAPMGNPADMPPPRKFDDSARWHIGKPDVVVSLQHPVIVKPSDPDQWLDVPTEDPAITTDRYIQAVEVKPISGPKVIHHAVSQMQWMDEHGAEQQSLLEEYAVGKFGDIYPEDTGMLIKAGTKLTVNLHLHAIGTEMPANVAVGIKLYPEGYVPKHVEVTQHTGDNEDFLIPANTKNVRVDGYSVLLKPARLTAFQPHLHNRGQAQCLEAIYPPAQTGGRAKKETLSCVDRYHFDWHIVYHYADDEQPILPAGTTLHVTSWFDNTTANKYNPDPSNPVAFGQRTIDDMSFSWVSWYYLTDEEYKQMVEERILKLKKETALNLPR